MLLPGCVFLNPRAERRNDELRCFFAVEALLEGLMDRFNINGSIKSASRSATMSNPDRDAAARGVMEGGATAGRATSGGATAGGATAGVSTEGVAMAGKRSATETDGAPPGVIAVGPAKGATGGGRVRTAPR